MRSVYITKPDRKRKRVNRSRHGDSGRLEQKASEAKKNRRVLIPCESKGTHAPQDKFEIKFFNSLKI